MKISVIICTHNRCESLKETIRSLNELDFSASEYEIIVVDNNSTDDTRAVVEELAGDSPIPLRYTFEGKVGLSHARNTGITSAQGEIVAFIDDDAVADKNWLKELSAVFLNEEKVGCVGGRVVLDFPKDSIPCWYNSDLAGYLSAFDLGGDHYRKVTNIYHFPYGTNISFLRRAIQDVGSFNTHLGRSGRSLGAGEEVELCLRLFKNGWDIYYQPKAIVEHIIPKERLSKRYFIGIAESSGMTRVIWDHSGKFGVCSPKAIIQYGKELWSNILRWIKAWVQNSDHAFSLYLAVRSSIASIVYGLFLKYRYR